MSDLQLGPSVFSAMQTGQPYKSYIKTVLGKVYITVLDPFSKTPVGILLEGNQKNDKDREKCIVNVWSEMEDAFLRRTNAMQFRVGNLKEYKLQSDDYTIRHKNEYTDEELTEFI